MVLVQLADCLDIPSEHNSEGAGMSTSEEDQKLRNGCLQSLEWCGADVDEGEDADADANIDVDLDADIDLGAMHTWMWMQIWMYI